MWPSSAGLPRHRSGLASDGAALHSRTLPVHNERWNPMPEARNCLDPCVMGHSQPRSHPSSNRRSGCRDGLRSQRGGTDPRRRTRGAAIRARGLRARARGRAASRSSAWRSGCTCARTPRRCAPTAPRGDARRARCAPGRSRGSAFRRSLQAGSRCRSRGGRGRRLRRGSGSGSREWGCRGTGPGSRSRRRSTAAGAGARRVRVITSRIPNEVEQPFSFAVSDLVSLVDAPCHDRENAGDPWRGVA